MREIKKLFGIVERMSTKHGILWQSEQNQEINSVRWIGPEVEYRVVRLAGGMVMNAHSSEWHVETIGATPLLSIRAYLRAGSFAGFE